MNAIDSQGGTMMNLVIKIRPWLYHIGNEQL